ncbi:MAG: ATP-dependent DNA helicase RecG [Bacteroidetes bacterium]|nr:ATP-dependent DNA helicase RecG [Bacteroidota bacterium]
MHHDFFQTKIEFLKGVGPIKAEILKKELGIYTQGDLLHHYPFRYVDRTKFYTVREANANLPYIQIKGVITSLIVRGEKRRKYLCGRFEDKTGFLELRWFQGIKWITANLKLNTEYVLFGKPTEFNGSINIVHPELELVSEAQLTVASSMQPVYSTTEKLKLKGLDSKGMLRLQKNLHQFLPQNLPETLPQSVLDEYKFLSRLKTYSAIHFPESIHQQEKAETRIKFEELFFLQLRLLHMKLLRTEKVKGIVFDKVGDYFNDFFHNHLPFALTNAQKKVIKEIRIDIGSGKQMNRLLQGDVGSGKTMVALMCMLIAIGNGYQACIMAPTEILANQHAESIASFLKNMNVNIALLTGSTRVGARRKIHEQLENGEINILIGTHALIEDKVQFKNLGFVVIDEQHRFGVEQRSRLWKKNDIVPHVLVMTATPIPRTLAMTLYGDLDVSVIDELPPGRKPISTVHKYDTNRLQIWAFLKKEIAAGRQVYIVYPLIEESEKIDLNNLMAGFESICRDFPAPQYHVSIVHGKMKPKDKDFEMQRFVKGETQIMVATTVIEVGVNVPNASVMIIENAERFGLSQLHQLRGRVGRGAEQSYCILMTSSKLGKDSRLRIATMCETNDGFRIAETDLKLRGPGDAEGTRQSGLLDLKLADLSRDAALVQRTRDIAIEILKADPQLSSSVNAGTRHELNAQIRKSGQWGRIS